MIQFVNVSKVYDGNRVALRDVNVFIDRGEFVFLVGPSGAGKSTFSRLIYRELTPTQGTVIVNGINVTRLRRREVPYLRRGIGIVFQDFKLLSGKTVAENVAFCMRVIGADAASIRKRVPQVLEWVGLADKSDAFPHELSGGEQQRVAIARAIVNRPRLILADEPTGNLDPETAWEIMNLLVEIHRMGATILVATHAKTIVDAMGRRVIALQQGRIVRDDLRGVYDDAN